MSIDSKLSDAVWSSRATAIKCDLSPMVTRTFRGPLIIWELLELLAKREKSSNTRILIAALITAAAGVDDITFHEYLALDRNKSPKRRKWTSPRVEALIRADIASCHLYGLTAEQAAEEWQEVLLANQVSDRRRKVGRPKEIKLWDEKKDPE